MKTILMSIKPEYVSKILDGTKKYEFRKKTPIEDVEKIVIYSTFPQKLIVGEVEVVRKIKMKPTPLWEETKLYAGITREKYRKYFKGCSTAYAYELGEVTIYDTPKSLSDYGISYSPQSYIYLKQEHR